MRASRTWFAAGLVLATSVARAEGGDLRRVDVELLDPAPAYPSQAVVSPEGTHVYVIAAAFDGPRLFVFHRDGDDTVVPIASPGLLGGDPQSRLSLASSADGRHVYASIGSERIVIFERDASSGSLTPIDALGDVSARLTSSPDGKNVYTLFPSLLATYARDETTGHLTRIDTENGISGPASFDNTLGLAVSPDGRHVYLGTAGTTPGAIGDAMPSLVVFARDPGTGTLDAVETIPDGANGVTGIALPMNVAVSPDGRHVYASGGSDDVATFARDAASGTLTFLGVAAGSGFTSDDLGSLAVSPDGERVVVGGAALGGTPGNDGLTIFRRDATSGLLTRLETLLRAPGHAARDLAGPTSLVFAPDGHGLYVTAGADGVLTAYRVLPHCAAEPVAGCVSGRSRIVLADRASDTLLWTWRGDTASGGEGVGDPRTTTDLAFCVHRRRAGDWADVLQLSVPAGSTCGATSSSCWRTMGTPPGSGGFSFRDASAQHDGVTAIRLTTRPDGRAAILLRGRGAALGLPTLPLGPAESVVAQLRTGDGDCWSAEYAAPARRDDAGQFADQD